MTPLDFDKLEQTKRLMQTLNKLTYRSKSLLHEFDKKLAMILITINYMMDYFLLALILFITAIFIYLESS